MRRALNVVGVCLAIGAVVVALSTYTAGEPGAPAVKQDTPRVVEGGWLVVYYDAETGCEYLATSANGNAGITPRLYPDGKPICRPHN